VGAVCGTHGPKVTGFVGTSNLMRPGLLRSRTQSDALASDITNDPEGAWEPPPGIKSVMAGLRSWIPSLHVEQGSRKSLHRPYFPLDALTETAQTQQDSLTKGTGRWDCVTLLKETGLSGDHQDEGKVGFQAALPGDYRILCFLNWKAARTWLPTLLNAGSERGDPAPFRDATKACNVGVNSENFVSKVAPRNCAFQRG